jgi:hypothetical protein
MDLIADDHRGLPRKRMEWIGDLNLASQMSGIMASRRWRAASVLRSSTPYWRRRYAACGIRRFMPPAELCRTDRSSPRFFVTGL